MDQQTWYLHKAVDPNQGTWLSYRKEWHTDPCYDIQATGQHRAKWKKPVTKDHLAVWDSIPVHQNKQLYRDRRRINGCLGLEVRGEISWNFMGICVGGGGGWMGTKVLSNQMAVMGAQLRQFTKNNWALKMSERYRKQSVRLFLKSLHLSHYLVSLQINLPPAPAGLPALQGLVRMVGNEVSDAFLSVGAEGCADRHIKVSICVCVWHREMSWGVRGISGWAIQVCRLDHPWPLCPAKWGVCLRPLLHVRNVVG